MDLFQFSPKTNLETRKDEKLEEKLLKDPLQIDLGPIYMQRNTRGCEYKKAGPRPAQGRLKAGGLHVSRPIKAGGVDVSRP